MSLKSCFLVILFEQILAAFYNNSPCKCKHYLHHGLTQRSPWSLVEPFLVTGLLYSVQKLRCPVSKTLKSITARRFQITDSMPCLLNFSLYVFLIRSNDFQKIKTRSNFTILLENNTLETAKILFFLTFPSHSFIVTFYWNSRAQGIVFPDA